jgi:hypothetical protein
MRCSLPQFTLLKLPFPCGIPTRLGVLQLHHARTQFREEHAYGRARKDAGCFDDEEVFQGSSAHFHVKVQLSMAIPKYEAPLTDQEGFTCLCPGLD